MIFWLFLLPLCAALIVQEPPPPEVPSSGQPAALWLDARLNHFDASNTETFPLRFYYNDEYAYNPDIVIMVGGAWASSQAWAQAGLAADLAQSINAGLIYTEHRYYGQSRPSEGTSVDDLRFLTADQALGDLAQLITYLKSDRFDGGRYKEGKVALVGCSHGGTLATWMRLAYPHLVDAVFSDGGPVHAQEDFPEYLSVVTEALRSEGGEACVASVEESMEQLVAVLETGAGPATVSSLFNTCTTISATTPLDLATFFWNIQQHFARLVQYSTPGDITAACEVLTSGNDPIQRLANWVTSQETAECLETRYTEVVAAHINTSYDAPGADMRLWMYQSCVQYGWYLTSDDHPFLSTVPLEYYHQMCKDFFGPSFDEAFLHAGIARTNLFFAGRSHLPDHVVTAAGGHDPWSPLQFNSTHTTELSPVIVLPGVAHCRVVRPISESENEEMTETKISVMNFLAMRLQGGPAYASAATRIAATLVAIALVVMAM